MYAPKSAGYVFLSVWYALDLDESSAALGVAAFGLTSSWAESD